MRKFLPKALFLSLAAFLVFSLVARQVFAATIPVSLSDMQGWAFKVTSPDLAEFVTGPTTPPLGVGSAHLATGASTTLETLLHKSYLGTKLADIGTLNYSAFTNSSAPVLNPVLEIYVNTDNLGPDILAFDPHNQINQVAQSGIWQNWDTLSPTGIWITTASTVCDSKSLAQYINCAGNPEITDVTNDGAKGFRFKAATGINGYVDNFTIGILGADTTYDFEPDVLGISAPTVTTNSAGAISATAATLNGSANPNSDTTTGWFRYATVDPTTCNDTFGTVTSPVGALGSGTSPVAYNKAVSGLSSSTQYYYCAIAANGGGTGLGSVLSFTTLTPPTPPTVTTTAASSITGTTATLNGTGNPNGDATTAWFRYAAASPLVCNDTFGTRVPLSGGTALGAGVTATAYNQPITGLTSGGTYYFCAIAGNGGGNGFGFVLSFTTPAVLGDTDLDGCSDTKELGPDWRLGGQRDPNNGWDFADVPVPALRAANQTGVRNKAVTIQDVLVTLYYVGTSDGGSPNANGVSYNTDWNNNGVPDGREYDRTPSTIVGQRWRSGPPNGAVSLQDVLVVLAQVGTNCN